MAVHRLPGPPHTVTLWTFRHNVNTGWEDKSATIVLDPSALPGIRFAGHDVLDDRAVPVGAYPDGGFALSVTLRRRSGTLVALRQI